VISRGNGGRPLVAAICRAPIVYEALSPAFDGLASLWRCDADRADADGLLESLSPDAIVVDCEQEAERLAAFADRAGIPLVHVSLHRPEVRILRGGGWESAGDGTPEAVRNVILAAILGSTHRW
jgi:hypothetical protein